MTEDKRNCFLCGIGGSGMSALARLLLAQGWHVAGSDRSRDRGETPEKFRQLENLGIELWPQNGSGIGQDTDLLIVSSAVEDSIPDVRAAKDKNVPIKKRADILAELFNAAPESIAVGGTSGKSTVTAMIGWILHHGGLKPTTVNGALMNNFGGANAVAGDGPFVAEVDESDGSIALFRPSVAVLTNVSLDHKSMDELRGLFGDFTGGAGTTVSNLDDRETANLPKGKKILTFSLGNPDADFYARDIRPLNDGVSFTVNDIPVRLKVPGRHNVANALAAIAASHAVGIPLEKAAAALTEYKGIGRRFDVIGQARGVTVIDDFAHNPDKIAATLRTLHEKPGRIFAVFQPHGFGPTKLMRSDLVKTLGAELREGDILLMPEIYYAGGTANRDISSKDIVDDVAAQGHNAVFFTQRKDIVRYLSDHVRGGDRIVIMGARDDTLPLFAKEILAAIKAGPAPGAVMDKKGLSC